MKLTSLFSIALCCATLLTGCGKDDKVSGWDRDVKDPLVDSKPQQDAQGAIKTTYCQPDPNGAYSANVNGSTVKYGDGVTTSNGHDDGGDYDFGIGGACINRPIREVMAAMQNVDYFHWDGTTEFDQTGVDKPDALTTHYTYHYHVSNSFPFPDVDWTMDWYFSIVKGTAEAPEQVVISYKKIDGTKYIDFWEGSATLDYIAPGITSITATDHINATRQGPSDSESSVKDVINKALSEAPNWDAIGGQSPAPADPSAPAPAPTPAPAPAPAPGTPAPTQPGDGDHSIVYCKPEANGAYHTIVNGQTVQYGDAVVTSNGHDKAGNFDFGLGGACVNRPIHDVWLAIQNQDFVHWSGTTSNVSRAPAPAGVTTHYVANYTVKNFLPFLTVSWTMDWLYSITTGTPAAPQTIVVAYKKALGSDRISLWEGSINLTAISDSLTSISIVNHLEATLQGPGKAEDSVKDLITKARTETPNNAPIGQIRR